MIINQISETNEYLFFSIQLNIDNGINPVSKSLIAGYDKITNSLKVFFHGKEISSFDNIGDPVSWLKKSKKLLIAGTISAIVATGISLAMPANNQSNNNIGEASVSTYVAVNDSKEQQTKPETILKIQDALSEAIKIHQDKIVNSSIGNNSEVDFANSVSLVVLIKNGDQNDAEKIKANFTKQFEGRLSSVLITKLTKSSVESQNNINGYATPGGGFGERDAVIEIPQLFIEMAEKDPAEMEALLQIITVTAIHELTHSVYGLSNEQYTTESQSFYTKHTDSNSGILKLIAEKGKKDDKKYSQLFADYLMKHSAKINSTSHEHLLFDKMSESLIKIYDTKKQKQQEISQREIVKYTSYLNPERAAIAHNGDTVNPNAYTGELTNTHALSELTLKNSVYSGVGAGFIYNVAIDLHKAGYSKTQVASFMKHMHEHSKMSMGVSKASFSDIDKTERADLSDYLSIRIDGGDSQISSDIDKIVAHVASSASDNFIKAHSNNNSHDKKDPPHHIGS